MNYYEKLHKSYLCFMLIKLQQEPAIVWYHGAAQDSKVCDIVANRPIYYLILLLINPKTYIRYRYLAAQLFDAFKRFIDLMILTDNEKSPTITVVIVIAFAHFVLEPEIVLIWWHFLLEMSNFYSGTHLDGVETI